MLSRSLLLSLAKGQTSSRQLSLSAAVLSKKIAVVLAGTGVYDGSEVHEAASVLASITRHGFEPVIAAPDVAQAHVVDHQTGQELEQERKVLNESARIAR